MLRFNFLGPILRGTALLDLDAKGLADVQPGSDKRSDAASLVFDASDGAHLIYYVKGGREVLSQLALPDALHLRGKDLHHEEDEQNPVLPLLGPAALAIEEELGLHLPEELFLLIAYLVVCHSLHCGLIQFKRHAGEEAGRLPDEQTIA